MAAKENVAGLISENQRVKFQRGKEDQHFATRVEIGDFSRGEMLEDQSQLGNQVLKLEMDQGRGLEMDIDVFFG